MSYETSEAAMRELGTIAGQNDGSWAVDGNTSAETAQAIIRGYEDGDPEVMDMMPSPLSGEFADGPFLPDIFEQVTGDRDYQGDDASDLLDAYEMAYSDAYWTTVLDSAKSIA